MDRLVRPFDREEVTLIPAGAEVILVTQEGIQRDHGEVWPLRLSPASNYGPVLRES